MGCTASRPNSEPTSKASIDPVFQVGFGHRYSLGHCLGSGSFARVFSCHYMVNRGFEPGRLERFGGKPLAVKTIKESSKKNKHFDLSVRHEARIWHHLSKERQGEGRKHIVLMFEVYYEKNRVAFFIMERCRMSLLSFLRGSEFYDEAMLAKVLRQMLLAVEYMHNCGVLHRDLKPDNFLVAEKSLIKVCDFGLSAFVVDESASKSTRRLQASRNLLGYGMTATVGTPPFMCPEMLLGEVHSEKMDVWSCGVIAYVLLCGDFPYVPKVRTSQSMKDAIKDTKTPPSFKPGPDRAGRPLEARGDYRGPSPLAKDFLKALLSRMPLLRPTASKALSFPFLDVFREAPRGPTLQPMLARACAAGAFEQVDSSVYDIADTVPTTPTNLLSSSSRQAAAGSGAATKSAPAATLQRSAVASEVAEEGLRAPMPVLPNITRARRDHLPSLLTTVPWSVAMKRAEEAAKAHSSSPWVEESELVYV